MPESGSPTPSVATDPVVDRSLGCPVLDDHLAVGGSGGVPEPLDETGVVIGFAVWPCGEGVDAREDEVEVVVGADWLGLLEAPGPTPVLPGPTDTPEPDPDLVVTDEPTPTATPVPLPTAPPVPPDVGEVRGC